MGNVIRVTLICLAVQLFLTGCLATAVKSKVVGNCYVLKQSQALWKTHENMFASGLIVGPLERPSLLVAKEKHEAILDAGTKLEIYRVLSGRSGSFGPYLRFQARVLDGKSQGVVADISACVPNHPRPRLIMCASSVDSLMTDKSILDECK